MKLKKTLGILGVTSLAIGLAGCVVNQAPETTSAEVETEMVEEVEEPRLIATSYATMQIFDALGIDLIARSETAGDLPESYVDLPTVGTAMSPDTEAIVMLEPTDVVGPDTLIETIKPTYDAADIPYTFIDLQSVDGLYESISMLGEKYGKEEVAEQIVAEYEASMANFQEALEGETAPRVLVLMGLPGAYIACTPNSYVGSLVELAGAENVVQVDTIENFVSWNTEELLALDPDMILLTAHGLPDLAMEMFTDEFATNDIWKNFRAVEEYQVFALDYDTFGMSATFAWTKAFDDLTEIFYGDTYESFID
ncbi:heme ABC transporter substrate-binding protein IsdE [Chakrabartyella piscis]|uniref:heme ABC transporter substrate-binding protein IsdE n=1 Tax=Chakrabartyella piscis TaxID=2918914 RepID=UPI002958CCD8|nr:heme ABC transporter substrate-binding protein IsdE [Chakrabartyella piscis]